MEESKQPSREEIENSLAEILKNKVRDVLNAESQQDILIFFNQLCNSI